MDALRSYLWMLLHHPMVRQNRLRFLHRILRWQMASRLLGKPVVLDFVNELRLLVPRGVTGLTVNFYAGLYEYEDMLFVAHALREEDLFVDVGANGGSYTVIAAGVGGARVLALEPVPTTYSFLLDNIHLNRLLGRVDAHNIGAGRQADTLRFTSTHGAANHVLQDARALGGGIEVPVLPLDGLIEEAGPQGAGRTLVLKLDVEGWETEVIAGAHGSLTTRRPCALLVEMNGSGARYGFDEAALHRELLALGFKMALYEPASRVLSEIHEPMGVNRLYVSEVAFFQDRVRGGAPIEVWGLQI